METILQYYLPTILGDFISGIDKQHMRTNFFSGKVSLQGVQINPNILKKANIPLKISYSNIGKLEVKIPWMKRLKEPIELYLEDLMVLLEPINVMDEFDIVEERIKFLDSLTEECASRLKDLAKADKKDKGGSMDYYKVLILDNLQINIKNIHVRLENPKKQYSAGFTLDEIYIRTINEKGQPEFLDRTLEENKKKDLFKKAYVKDFSLYWNAFENPTYMVCNENFKDDYKRAFLKEFILKGEKKMSVEPILMISLESHLVFKNLNKPNHEKEPRYRVEINLKPINITVGNDQVNQVINLVDSFTLLMRTRKKKYELPNLTEDELINETIIYKRYISEFLMQFEEKEYTWVEEFKNSKKKQLIENITKCLSRLTNDAVQEASKEIILQFEKRRALKQIEKKSKQSGGMFSFFKKDDPNEKQNLQNQEMQKVESFFDSFMTDQTDSLSSLGKGLLLEANIRLSEANFYLMHGKSQQGVQASVTNMNTSFSIYKSDDFDLFNFKFSVQNMDVYYIQKYPGEDYYKKMPVMKRFDHTSDKQLTSFSFRSKHTEMGQTLDIDGNVVGIEFRFMPEFVIVLKKYFQFDREKMDDNFADYAYEKFTEASKNAQNQIKTFMNEYSSDVNVELNFESFVVVLPLRQRLGNESDCWLVNVGLGRIFSGFDESFVEDRKKKYELLNYELNNISIKYIEKINVYEQIKLSLNDPQFKHDKMITLMNDTKLLLSLKILNKNAQNVKSEDPEIDVLLNLDSINFNVDSDMLKHLIDIQYCFDFKQEKEFHEYLENEKQLIMKNSDGLFKVYYRDPFDISSEWNQYIMVCSGFYLYFFKNPTDLEATKNVFIKKASIKQDKENYDFPYVLKIKNKYEEVVIAMEDDSHLNKLINVVIKKNEEYNKNYLTINVQESDIVEKNKSASSSSTNKEIEDINKIEVRAKINFQGIAVGIFETDQLVDKLGIVGFSMGLIVRPLDTDLTFDLQSIYITDYVAVKGDQKEVLILSSEFKPLTSLEQQSAENLAQIPKDEVNEEEQDLIKAVIKIYDDKHPTFQEQLNEKEFEVKFNKLSLNWIPERVFFLAHFVANPLKAMKEEEDTPKKQSTIIDDYDPSSPEKMQNIKNEFIKFDSGLKEKQYIAKKNNQKKVVRFATGTVHVKELSMTLTTQISWVKVANASVSNFNMSVAIDKDTQKYKGSLENLEVFDLTNYQQNVPEGQIKPNQLVGIEKGHSVLEFDVLLREDHYLKATGNNVSVVINIELNHIRLVYVQQPVLRIVSYVLNFIMDFDYGTVISDEEKYARAIYATKTLPTFVEVKVKANHPKIKAKPKTSSNVYFELDLGAITISNETDKTQNRFIQKLPGFEFVYIDRYFIETSETKITRVTNDNERKDLSENFKLYMEFERCLFYEEYIIAAEIQQNLKYKTLDNTFFFKGYLTPVLAKFNQEDFLDVMDLVFYNFAFDDYRDPELYIDEEMLPEMIDINAPTPIDLNLSIEYVAALAIDQQISYPLAKIMASDMVIKFFRRRNYDKHIEIHFNKVVGSYFEDGEEQNEIIEKTLFGQTFNEKTIDIEDKEDMYREFLCSEFMEEEKMDQSKDKCNLLKVDVDMGANKNKDIMFDLKSIKIMCIMSVIMRLKDFFMIYFEIDEMDNVQNAPNFKTRSMYRGVINKAEICLPATDEASVIIRSSIIFDIARYDVVSLLNEKKDFLLSSIFSFNFDRNEIFVFHEKLLKKDSKLSKRSIIFPFAFSYKSKEFLSYEKTNKQYIAKYENNLIFDKVILRVSAADSLITMRAIEQMSEEFKQFQTYAPFPKSSKYTEHANLDTGEQFDTMTILYTDYTIYHSGVQIRVLNDFSGLAVPILDMSLHSTANNAEVKFEQSITLFQGKNSFAISSSFYNSKVSKWEPVLEKWPFTLEIDFSPNKEYNQRIDLVSDDNMCLNISDEMLQILLTAYSDWEMHFKRQKQTGQVVHPRTMSQIERIRSDSNNNKLRTDSVMKRSRLMTTTSRKVLEEVSKAQLSNVEYVSPCTIWNDTGYHIKVEPILMGADMMGISSKRALEIPPGEEADLLMEWDIDRMFEASTNQSVMERMKVNIILDHPEQKAILIPNLDIHNFGTRRRQIKYNNRSKVMTIVCNVFDHKRKKLVRFSSAMVIKNALSIPLVVQIHNRGPGPESNFLVIKPNSSSSLPLDKINYEVSFHGDVQHKDTNYATFIADQLINYDQAEIRFGSVFARMRTQRHISYNLVYIESLYSIKNCLPFPVVLDAKGSFKGASDTMTNILATQEDCQLLRFSSNTNISLILRSERFHSNEFTIAPLNMKNIPDLYFYKQDRTVMLDVLFPHAHYTKHVLIYAKSTVLNQTSEKLSFFAYNEAFTANSPFNLELEDGNEIVLFDQIQAMKIKSQNEGSSLSDPVALNRLGVQHIDVYDGQKQTLNLSIKVTNELADRAHNLFTKVIIVTPRFVFNNSTNHNIYVYQHGSDRKIHIKPGQRKPFHFPLSSKDHKEKRLRIRLIPDKDNNMEPSMISEEWADSGYLDVASPGDLQFLCQSKSRDQIRFFSLSVTLEEAYFFIRLSEREPNESLIQIQNNIDHFDLRVNQWGINDSFFTVGSGNKIPFAWAQPCQPNKIQVRLQLKNETSSEMLCKLDRINQVFTDTVMFQNGNISVSYFVKLQGSSRIIKIYSIKNKEEKKEEKTNMIIRVNLPALRCSLISGMTARKFELAHLCLAPIMFAMVDKGDFTTYHFRVKIMMIDNNISPDVMYPVIMFPDRAKKLKERDLPFIDIVCSIQNKKKPTDIMYIKNFGFYISEATLCLDGQTVNQLSTYIRTINTIMSKTVAKEIEIPQYMFLSENKKKDFDNNMKNCLSWRTIEPQATTSDFIYIEKLAIQPIFLNLTFKNLQFEDKDSFVFAFVKKALGKALANFDRAPIRLKGIELDQSYGTKPNVIGLLLQRYKSVTAETVMGIVFSSGIIGNPVKFFDRVSSGFGDLVEKPVQGFLDGPISGGVGIIAGAGSFVGKTVGATFNSLHSITDSFANGLSSLTGDKEYMEKREKANRKENKNVLTGSVKAVESIGKGIFNGLTGVIEKPIEGGMQGGFKGFMKGIYKGTKGLVIKPVTGVLDGVSKITEGVSNTFVSDIQKKVLRSRVPRVFYGRECVYKAYHIEEASMNQFLYKKKPKKYGKFTFLEAIFLRERLPNMKQDPEMYTLCLWITLERIFLVNMVKHAIVWKIRTTNLQDVFTDSNSVNLTTKKPTKSVKGNAAKVPCSSNTLKARVFTILGILQEIIEENYL